MKLKQILMFISGGAMSSLGASALNNNVVHADTVTVQKGDTTWNIAQKHKTTVNQIVKDNNLQNGGSLIFINQKLEVNSPSTNSSSTSAQAQSSSYTQPVQNYNSNQNNQKPTTTFQSTSSYSQAQSQQYNALSNTQISGSENSAKEWIAARESGGSYAARNGRYIGRYQLDSNYLNGDWSPANQERVANNYVKNRYGSWANAQAFWQRNGWY